MRASNATSVPALADGCASVACGSVRSRCLGNSAITGPAGAAYRSSAARTIPGCSRGSSGAPSERPSDELLPDREQMLAAIDEVYDTYRTQGPAAAWPKDFAAAGFHPPAAADEPRPQELP